MKKYLKNMKKITFYIKVCVCAHVHTSICGRVWNFYCVNFKIMWTLLQLFHCTKRNILLDSYMFE